RPITLGLLGAAALTAGLTAGLLLTRPPREFDATSTRSRTVPSREKAPDAISLDRLRAQGY
ncbi:MAG TPA: hypothetical protein VJ997_09910, partial [Longimicrobiales bacterium]|nr:hypothetical protein [Longimicrobiales bacterium]